MKEKSQSFISVIIDLQVNKLEALNHIEALQQYLDARYNDYELLLLVQKNAQRAVHHQIDSLLKTVPAIRYLQLTNNIPTDVALAAGLENAIGDFLVLLDPVGDPLDLIEKSVSLCKEGNDVIVGTAKTKSSPLYAITRPLVSWALASIDYKLPRNATNFRCLSRRATNAVIATGHFHQQFFMRIQNSGFEQKVLPYISFSSEEKTFYKGVREMMRLMVFNSSSPLRFISMLGLSGSAIACVVALYAVLMRFIRDDIVGGWASTFLLISFFSFLQFVILAFISEYLGRLLTEQDHSQDYAIIFEKNSAVMVNQDRINVLEISTSADENFVQTGRNK